MKGLSLKNRRTRERRERAGERLLQQLKNGTKTTKEGEVPLTKEDEKRIRKELATIDERTGR
jgi:hypothetical protein